jgi:two-component system C4-dicarboxylate transport sensor histidine kinase DctB
MERPRATPRRRRRMLAVGAVALYLLTLWQVTGTVYRRGLGQLSEAARYELNLHVTHLRGLLEKYEHLPALLAADPQARALLRHPGDRVQTDRFNRHLATVGAITGASDIYLMNAEGLTVAASNWQDRLTFIGRNFRWRPYFQQAMAGELGRYFALGTTSLKRGYYFAYPVRNGATIVGAMVVKVDMSDVEREWRGRAQEIVVADEDGVLFISTWDQWRLRTLAPLSADRRAKIEASTRFPGAALEPLPVEEMRPVSGGHIIAEIRNSAGKAHGYLLQGQAMPEAGWTVYLLTPTEVLRPRLLAAFAITSSAFAALLFLGLYVRQRSNRRRCQLEAQQALQAAHDQLERRVEERTAALQRTEEELVHAAKLAAIGQLSTGISHEINQPLAALRSYADNARLLLAKGRVEEASGNLREIAGLTERIAQISSQLKLFARKTHGRREPVSLRQAIDNALSILRPQLKKTATEIRIELPEPSPQVMADPVQLEQVLVNLMGNALDAMEAQPHRCIAIHGQREAGELRLSIRDNGPGIPAENLARIFDPYFTTREAGLGLGLSISHRIAESMGGRLDAANHPDGGALFTLILADASATA